MFRLKHMSMEIYVLLYQPISICGMESHLINEKILNRYWYFSILNYISSRYTYRCIRLRQIRLFWRKRITKQKNWSFVFKKICQNFVDKNSLFIMVTSSCIQYRSNSTSHQSSLVQKMWHNLDHSHPLYHLENLKKNFHNLRSPKSVENFPMSDIYFTAFGMTLIFFK